ncbi:DUF952 domain-containing protein [Frankia sp. AiPs1]
MHVTLDEEPTPDERVICHLVGRAAWTVGASAYRPASLGVEGFIHFSTPAQVVATAERYYRGRDDLLLVVVDPRRLRAPLRWEPPAHPPGGAAPDHPTADRADAVSGRNGAVTDRVEAGSGERFPHLYGPLNAGAVMVVVPFPPERDGTFRMPATVW